jgi:hypothetical protein
LAVADRDRGAVSRRTTLRAAISLMTFGAAGRALAQQAPAPAQKIDQKAVQYQTFPKNGQSCNKCVNFEPPSSCKLVAGTISPAGWCLLFGPKPA